MIAKVIPFSYNTERHVREPDRYDMRFPDHFQKYDHPDLLVELFDYVFRNELTIDPGEPMDTIIVNSDTGNADWNNRLFSVNGQKTPWGRIIVMNRPNIGWSFGAFADAIEVFRDSYTGWLFTEDDILFTKNGYLAELVERFRTTDAGFVANAVCDGGHGPHAGGGVGFTSTEVLNRVRGVFRGAAHDKSSPVYNGSFLTWRAKVIEGGEIPFTNDIHLLGMPLVAWGNQRWFAQDSLCQPFYHIKHRLYKT